jgi:hypothetical protein
MTARTTRRPAQQLAQQMDPKKFDLDAFLGMFTPPTVTVPLYKRADLLPELDRLDEQIARAEKHDAQADQSVSDGGGAEALIAKRNELLAELEASAEQFEFKALSGPLIEKALQSAKDAGETLADPVDADTALTLRFYQMAETCISHPGITPAAFRGLWERMGEATMVYMIGRWLAVQGLGDPDAPFSQPASPTPTTG